jgi:hypothetical protein
VGTALDAIDARARRHVHDRAGSLGDHVRSGLACAEVRTAEVQVDRAVERTRRQIGERAEAGPARVVDQDVDPPELVDGARDEAHDIGLFLHVRRHRDALPSRRLRDLRRDALELARGAAGDHRVGTVLREQPCSRGTDTGAAARDDRDTAGEIEPVVRHRRVPYTLPRRCPTW